MCVLTLYQDVLTPLKDRKNNWTKTAQINFGPLQCRLAANAFFKKKESLLKDTDSFHSLCFLFTIFCSLPALFLFTFQSLLYTIANTYLSHGNKNATLEFITLQYEAF